MDGILVVDKAAGMTSHDVVARLRRISGERSIGHLGTLDPMATGVLPLLLGRMTRLAQFYLPSQSPPDRPSPEEEQGLPESPPLAATQCFRSGARSSKAYEGEIRLGVVTDTYDADGEPIAGECRRQPVALSLEAVRQAAAAFRGTIWQTPPPFSAKKIQGVPAYKLARKGQKVKLRPVQVEVEEFEIAVLEGETARFRAVVSPGTYVRSLAHELGQALGCGAHLASLRRIRSGEFGLEEAHTLEEIEEAFKCGGPDAVSKVTIHPRRILPEMPAVTAPPEALGRLRNGGAVNLPEMSDAPLVKVFANRDELLAVARRIAGTLFQPMVVLATAEALRSNVR